MLIHDRFSIVVVIVAAVGAVAAIVTLFRPQVLRAVRVYLRFTAIVVAVQVLIGLLLVATGHRPAQLLHWFYGAATLATLPLAMYIGGKLGGHEKLIWVTGGAVFTLLFAFRAVATG